MFPANDGLRPTHALVPARACVRPGRAVALAGRALGAGRRGDREDARQDDAHARPSCPKTPCEAVGSVTGFQMVADGDRGVFKARENGCDRRLGDRPLRAEPLADELLRRLLPVAHVRNAAPTARISVIKRQATSATTSSRRRARWSTLSSGARHATDASRSARPAEDPQGRVPGLTIPTWSPSFAVEPRPAPTTSGARAARTAVRGHRQHQGRQGAAEGRLDPRLRLRLQHRAAPLLGLLRAHAGRRRRTRGLSAEGGLAEPAVRAVADVEADQLVAAAADAEVLGRAQERRVRGRQRQGPRSPAPSPRRSRGRGRRRRARPAA